MGSLTFEKDFEPSAVTPRGLAPPALIPNGDFGEMKRLKVASTPTTPRKNLNLLVSEPGKNDGPSLDCILMNYIDTLTQRINYHIVSKAAMMYRMDFEMINSSINGEMDYSDLKAKLLQNKGKPAIINVTIGTTFKGAVDDLDIILQTLEDCGYTHDQFYIHCDAALNGLIIPFIKNMISFKKPIGSVTISGHKFLGCPMPCGIQITRKSYINNLSRRVEYIASVDATISGSRNGLAPIFLWYSLSAKGHIGFQKDVKRCLDNAKYLKDRLQQAGISVMLNELSIIVVLERPRDHEFVRRWQLSCVRDMAHVIVMPGITRETLDSFINDLLQQRKKWYQDGRISPPCVANDIGAQNCTCSYHKIDFIIP
ncbi:hypothetical protein HAX54_051986 [Datura stramonium]|uniref:Uncharacterized protein n=1 Tax=Datura stramonium TaxID=4076 RepID=A0ABS8SZB6_DATST|nr:hypothetical protein [Datura stramonium]